MKRTALAALLMLPVVLLVPARGAYTTPAPTPVYTPTPKPKPKPPRHPVPPPRPPVVPPTAPPPTVVPPTSPPPRRSPGPSPQPPAPAPVPSASPGSPSPTPTPAPSASPTPSGTPLTLTQSTPATFVPNLGSSTLAAGYGVVDSLEARMNALRNATREQPALEQPADFGYSKDGKQYLVSEKRVVPGDVPQPRGSVWVNAGGDFGSDSSRDRWAIAQGVLGADLHLAPTWVGGITAGVSRTWGDLGSHGSYEAWNERIGLYTTYWRHGFWLQGAALGGLGQYDVHAQGFHGSADGWDFTGYAGTGYDFHPGVWSIGPFTSFQFDRLEIDHNGNGNFGRAKVGLRASGRVGCVTPYAAVAYERQTLNRSLRSGPIVDPNAVWAQLGAEVELNDRWSLYADDSIEVGTKDYFNDQVNVGVRLRF